jgi:type VI secretion system protein ImpM
MSESPVITPSTSNSHAVAWYGKLPSAADFVGRRMPHAIETAWDHWVRSGMDQLRHEAGASWQAQFLNGPTWFFMYPTQIQGVLAAGAIAPSMDRVGRHYPITVMAFSAPQTSRFTDDTQVSRFFSSMRSAVLDARRIPLQIEQMDERVAHLCSPFEPRVPPDDLIVGILGDLESASVEGSAHSHSDCLPGLDWRHLFSAGSETSIWWVSPSAQFRHELVVHHGPLHRPLFARLFKGPATSSTT